MNKIKFLLGLLSLCYLILISNYYTNAQQRQLTYIGSKPPQADTIRFMKIFSSFLWDVKLFKGKKEIGNYIKCSPDTIEQSDNIDRIILTTSFTIDSSLLNKTFVFYYESRMSFNFKVNNREIVNLKKPFKTNRFTIYNEYEKNYVYFSFDNTQVKLTAEYENSDACKAVNGEFYLAELIWKDEYINKFEKEKKTSLIKLFFYLAIGIVMLIQYLYFRKRPENLYFSLLCFSFSLYLFSDFVASSSFVQTLFFVFLGLFMEFLSSYLSIVLTEKEINKIPLKIYLGFIPVFIITQATFPFYEVYSIMDIVCVLFVLYNSFLSIYLLFQGGSKKKWEVKFISYGFFASIIIFILFLIITGVLSQNSDNANITDIIYRFSNITSLLLIPLTIAIIIGKRNGLNQTELISQYEEIKSLSEENLKKEKEKQQLLTEQNTVLEIKVNERTSELMQQKEIVEQKNREIVDSISYALRIQSAILPPLEFISSNIEHSFVFYKPKDIVAGDFYWAEKVGDYFFIAAADCTGHGVPGAMVSLVCSNALDRSVNEFGLKDTDLILDNVRKLVLEVFSKSGENIRDGMDISLCRINKTSHEVQWSGANNPLWYFENNELKEIKADKQPIGKYEHAKPFTAHLLKLQKDTALYMFTDGYADQFNSTNKKMTKKKFKDHLASIQHLSMQAQHKDVENYFNNWMNGVDQIDDVCVVGVKL